MVIGLDGYLGKYLVVANGPRPRLKTSSDS